MRLEEVDFYYDTKFGINEHRDGVELYFDKYESPGLIRRTSYVIADLYRDRRAAEAAVLEERAKLLRQTLERSPELVARLGITMPPVDASDGTIGDVS